MDCKQYLEKMNNDPDWMPGREAIEKLLESLYGGAPPEYIKTPGMSLYGILLCHAVQGYIQLTTCGLSQIYPSEYAYGRDRSGWGMELTMRLKNGGHCKAGAKLLSQLADYAEIRKVVFQEYFCLPLNRIIKREPKIDKLFPGVVFVPDTVLGKLETVHGSVEFLQVVNINGGDWKHIKNAPTLARQYVYEKRKIDPALCFDFMDTEEVME